MEIVVIFIVFVISIFLVNIKKENSMKLIELLRSKAVPDIRVEQYKEYLIFYDAVRTVGPITQGKSGYKLVKAEDKISACNGFIEDMKSRLFSNIKIYSILEN